MEMKCKHGLCHRIGSLLGSTVQEANLGKGKCKVSGKSQDIKVAWTGERLDKIV